MVDKPVQTQSHAQQQQTCEQEHCPGETGLPSSVFKDVHGITVKSTTFPSLELLIQCWFIWKETMQLVSRMVGFNAFQVYFLWHTFFSQHMNF